VSERALVIVPTYNERENIRPLIESVLAKDPRIDMLIVDDGSPDGTGAIVDEVASTNSRVFALHTLPATPHDALTTSLSLVRTLGMRSGHAGDKMAEIPARPGVTGSPILAETLTYVEARVVATLDGEELTIFLADVVGGGRLRSGDPLTLRVLREHLPKEWQAEWATSREVQVNEARRRRGLR